MTEIDTWYEEKFRNEAEEDAQLERAEQEEAIEDGTNGMSWRDFA